MADDSDGEYIDKYSDDDFNDHQVTSGTDREGGLESAVRGARSGPTSHGGGGRRARDRGKKARARAAWEEGKFTWDIPEDEEGNVSLTTLLEAEKRRRLLRDTTPLQRGIIRHLVLVLDWSTAMLEKDLLPNRFRLTLNYAVEFIREYFEQNPISQMGVVVMWNGIARRVSEMSGNPAILIDNLREFEKEKEPEGDPSLQNALEMCRGELLYVLLQTAWADHVVCICVLTVLCGPQPCPIARYPRSPHNIRRPPLERSRRYTRHHKQPHSRSHPRVHGRAGSTGSHLRGAL